MRSIVVAVTLLLAGFAQAAPTFDFHAEHTRIGTGTVAVVHVAATSEETAHDVVVRLEWSEGLTLLSEIDSGAYDGALEWQCAVSSTERSASCQVSEFRPNESAAIYFIFAPTDSAGGHRSATAMLSAREVGTVGTVVFDVVATLSLAVTTTSDFGAGSLRAAIEEVNANPLCGTDVPCAIHFGGYLGPPMTIAPATPLPPLRKCNVALTGYEDVEFPRPNRQVTISGENATYGNGLEVRASCAAGIPGVFIGGLAVHSWPWNGIHFASPEPWGGTYAHTVSQVYVGTDATGLIGKGNGSRGINVDSPHDLVSVYSSIVSANGRSGIAFWQGKRGVVSGCKLGVNRENQPLGNGAGGFFSGGVPFRLTSNVIAYNRFSGAAVMPGTSEAVIAFNEIYANANLPIDWGIDDRSPSDDESDGILNAPRILDAFYNDGALTTTIRGVVRLRAGAFGGSFGLEFYRASSERGDVTQHLPLYPMVVAAPQEGTADVPFEITIAGVHRGTFVAAQTLAGTHDSGVSSEISEGVRVR
jgi:hypothetical protein